MPTYARADARLPVLLPSAMLDELRNAATAEGESLASLVRAALREWLALREAERERREEPEK